MLGEELAGAGFAEMKIAAAYVYDRAVSELERQQIEAYIQDKWFEPSDPPTVTITAPANGSSYDEGDEVSFVGTASDNDDGPVSDTIMWSSSLDGAIGGPSATLDTSALSVGVHTITASATDSDGDTGFDAIQVTIVGSGPPPTTDLPVTSGLVLQLESDQNVVDGGGFVGGWLDGSGNGNDLVTSTGGPVTGAVTTPTGLPSISFDGVDDKLERIDSLNNLNSFPIGNSARTMFLVVNYTNATAYAGAAYGTGATNQSFGLVVANAGLPENENLTLQGWGGGNDLVSSTQGSGAGWLVQAGLHDGTDAFLYKDGGQIDTFTHTYATTDERSCLPRRPTTSGSSMPISPPCCCTTAH